MSVYRFHVVDESGALADVVEKDFGDAAASATAAKARKYARDLFAHNAFPVSRVEAFSIPLVSLGRGAWGLDHDNPLPVLFRGAPYIVTRS